MFQRVSKSFRGFHWSPEGFVRVYEKSTGSQGGFLRGFKKFQGVSVGSWGFRGFQKASVDLEGVLWGS